MCQPVAYSKSDECNRRKMSNNIALAISTTFISCCSAVIFLELLVKEDPGCGNVVTFSAFLFISLEGFFTTMDFGRKKPKVPLIEWFKLVIAFFISNVINNSIFNFNIAVPLYTVFRSVSNTLSQLMICVLVSIFVLFQGSLAASLVAEKIVLARNHSRQKHLSVAFISIGIVIVTLESGREFDNQATFADWCIGILMLLTSLILSSLMGVHQERVYAKWGKHYQEALFFTVSVLTLLERF